MGKRKRKDKDDKIAKRLKRIERYLCRSSTSSENSEHGSYSQHEHHSRSLSRYRSPGSRYRGYSRSKSPSVELYNSKSPSVDENWLTEAERQNEQNEPTVAHATQSTSTVPAQPNASTGATDKDVPPNILKAFGDPKGKEEVFGSKIPDEISKRWGRVLVDGLTRDIKQDLSEKMLVPENFQLLKAPLLNDEISTILSNSVRNRDTILQKVQNHLGLGIAGLTELTTSLIDGEFSRIELIKKLSEINQIFLDLHHENTATRRKLIISSLDKNFVNMIKDVKRDSHLFGANLGEKIRASKTAQKSGLQIKRSDGSTANASRKNSQQGNWKGPSRYNNYRASAPRHRYASASSRRTALPPPPADRLTGPAPKSTARTRKN